MKAILQKAILLVPLFFVTTILSGQTPDSLGTDDKPLLNRQEATLLNSFRKNKQDTFDFKGKQIAFVTGSTGGRLLAKSYYFKTFIKPWIDKGSSPQCFVVQLTAEERLKSGGYDAIVLSWVKLFTDKQRKKIISRLQLEMKEG
ncbi:MAG TPA: hypothetical protein VMR70_07560 [Flavisolibacter sp.]|nr:hypothetical protein [Flavisolibacter sp.]